jgi:hypothetical protein
MNLDEMVKYLIWIIFFGLALAGVYLLLKKIGVI